MDQHPAPQYRAARETAWVVVAKIPVCLATDSVETNKASCPYLHFAREVHERVQHNGEEERVEAHGVYDAACNSDERANYLVVIPDSPYPVSGLPQQVEVLAFNDILRNGIPARSAVLGGSNRLELIRSKDFARWCRDNTDQIKSSGLLKDKEANADVETMTKALAELLIERRCLVNAQRKFLKPPPGQSRLIKFPKKVLPVAGPEAKLFHEDGFMCWTYDRPTPTWVYVVSALSAVGVVLLCLFPVAPSSVKISVMYAATGLLVLLTSFLMVRGVIALLSYLVTGRTVWVLPNSLDDNLPFKDSFKPLVSVELSELSTAADKVKHYGTRLVLLVTVGISTNVLYRNTPGQESLKKNVGRYRDDLFDYFNVYNNRDMIGDGKKDDADSSDKPDVEDPVDLDDLDFDDLDIEVEDTEVPDKEL